MMGQKHKNCYRVKKNSCVLCLKNVRKPVCVILSSCSFWDEDESFVEG